MTLERISERAWIVRNWGAVEPWRLAEGLNAIAASPFIEAVPAFETVGLHLDREADESEVRAWLSRASPVERAPAQLGVPVLYDGPDLQTCAAELGLEPTELVQFHVESEMTCRALGFAPGFPYLAGLAEPLCGLARLPSPRPHVPAGSVGITGRFTGIYPGGTPGGWRLIGRTPIRLVDPEAGVFHIRPGDVVRFRAIDAPTFAELEARDS